jgi:aspartate racemase
MKTVGIIGGIAPESTIAYYRQIISSYQQMNNTGDYPQIIINSINMTKMLDLIAARRLSEVTEYLAEEVNKLSGAGADFAIMASNTPHIVCNQVQQLSNLPLISIVETTCEKIAVSELKRVALFGTKFTMQGGFYDEVLTGFDIEVIKPEEEDQNYIHDKYMSELVNGVFLDETRTALLKIIEKLKQQNNVEGLILGGTELPLILEKGIVKGIDVFDTTEIHVESVVSHLSIKH